MALSVSGELSVRRPTLTPRPALPSPLASLPSPLHPAPPPAHDRPPPPTPTHLRAADPFQVTAYESFLNLSPANLRLFLQSGTEAQYAQCRARQPMMDDIR